jgi:RsiW-degrading membrane proteinase PrsW (M82 family)
VEILALVLAPALFWLWFFYRKDAIHPEPRALVAQVFFAGTLAVIPALVIEVIGGRIIPFDGSRSIILLFLGTMLIVGPAEELSKYAVVRWRIWNRPEFDEPVDGIVYAAAGALGFAAVENVFYVLHYGLAVMLLRGPVSTVGHVLFSACWGYALGLAKQSQGRKGAALIRGGLITASLVHGAFDFFLSTTQTASYWAILAPLAYVLLFGMWRVTMSEIKEALQWRPNPPGAPPGRGPAAKALE